MLFPQNVTQHQLKFSPRGSPAAKSYLRPPHQLTTDQTLLNSLLCLRLLIKQVFEIGFVYAVQCVAVNGCGGPANLGTHPSYSWDSASVPASVPRTHKPGSSAPGPQRSEN